MANYYVYISPKNIDAFQMYVTWGGTRISYSKSNATVVGDYLRCTLNVTSQAPNKIEISSAGYVNMTFDNPTFTQSGSDYSFYITLQEPPAHLYKWYNKTERCTFWTDTDKPTTSAHIYNSDGLDLTEKYVGSVSGKSWAFSYASMLRMTFRFTAASTDDYWYYVPGPRYVHTSSSYDFVYDRDSTADLVWDPVNNRYNVESTGQLCHYCSIEYLYGWERNVGIPLYAWKCVDATTLQTIVIGTMAYTRTMPEIGETVRVCLRNGEYTIEGTLKRQSEDVAVSTGLGYTYTYNRASSRDVMPMTLYTQNLSRSEVILDSLRLVDTNLNVNTSFDANKISSNILNSAGLAWEHSDSGQFKIIPEDLSRTVLNNYSGVFKDKNGNNITSYDGYNTVNFILVLNVNLYFKQGTSEHTVQGNTNLLLLKLDSDIYIVSGFHNENIYSMCDVDIASVFAPLSYITSYFTASSEYFPIDVIPGLLDFSGTLVYLNSSNNWDTEVDVDASKTFGLLVDFYDNLIMNSHPTGYNVKLNIDKASITMYHYTTVGNTINLVLSEADDFTRSKLQDLKWNYSTGVYDLVFPTTPRESLYGWKEATTSDILYTKSDTAVVGMPLYTESGEDANLVIDTIVDANTITASIPLKSYNVTYDDTSYTAQAIGNNGLQITGSTKTEIDLGSDFIVTEI